MSHSQATEELLQVVRQIRTTSITGVHSNEDSHVRINRDLFANKLNQNRLAGGLLLFLDLPGNSCGLLLLQLMLFKRFLDGLNLLRDSGQHALLETIELVETSPSADLTQSDKDASHGLEIERLVAVKDDYEAAELVAERLHRLGLTGTGWTERRAAETGLESLRHRQVAAVGEWRLNELVLNAQILESVEEFGVGHLDG